MSSGFFKGFLIGIFLISLGKWLAHKEISRGCDRLGSFYVNKITYECKAKQEIKDEKVKG